VTGLRGVFEMTQPPEVDMTISKCHRNMTSCVCRCVACRMIFELAVHIGSTLVLSLWTKGVCVLQCVITIKFVVSRVNT